MAKSQTKLDLVMRSNTSIVILKLLPDKPIIKIEKEKCAKNLKGGKTMPDPVFHAAAAYDAGYALEKVKVKIDILWFAIGAAAVDIFMVALPFYFFSHQSFYEFYNVCRYATHGIFAIHVPDNLFHHQKVVVGLMVFSWCHCRSLAAGYVEPGRN